MSQSTVHSPRILGPSPPQGPLAAKSVEVRVVLGDGRLQSITPPKIAGVGSKAIAAMTACLQDEGYALRLREHRDTIAIVLRAS